MIYSIYKYIHIITTLIQEYITCHMYTLQSKQFQHTSNILSSQWERIVPGPPWFSISTPSKVEQLKCLLPSSWKKILCLKRCIKISHLNHTISLQYGISLQKHLNLITHFNFGMASHVSDVTYSQMALYSCWFLPQSLVLLIELLNVELVLILYSNHYMWFLLQLYY